jgi:hypothetical protein
MRLNLAGRSTSWVRGIAAVLLALQVFAGGAVALAHAEEPLGGPTRLESHHSAQCVPLHDVARCVQCQYQAMRSLPADKRRLPEQLEHPKRPLHPDGQRIVARRSRPRASPPRAPPSLLA